MRIPFFHSLSELRPPLLGAGFRAGFFLGLMLLVPVLTVGSASGEQPVMNSGNPQTPPSRSELFLAAQAAYDDGNYLEAAGLYSTLISNGVDNVELFYNRANALFREGDLPAAVLDYRKVWHQTPRDPDIRANLRFALNAAGAVELVPPLPARIFTAFSKSEWIALMTGSYIALTVLLLLGVLIRSARRLLWKMILLLLLLILLSAGGWLHWHGLSSNPEWVVVKAGATALFGPIDGATAHFKVPLAALVRQHQANAKGWIEIEYDGKTGWLKETYIERVSP